MATQGKTPKSIIAELESRQIPTSDAIAKALEQYQEEEQQRQSKAIIQNLAEIDAVLNVRLIELQRARKIAKAQKTAIVAVSKAKDQYLQDADFNAFGKAVSKAEDKLFFAMNNL